MSISIQQTSHHYTLRRTALCHRKDGRKGLIVSNRAKFSFTESAVRNTTSSNCDASVNYNQGCGVSFSEKHSYGANFNAAGGGFYIMEKNHEKGVSVWFIERFNIPFIGDELNLDLVLLSTPDAYFPLQDDDWSDCNCSYSDHFNAHDIVFDLTFCVSTLYMSHDVVVTSASNVQGDWAGSVWATSSCASKASSCASCKFISVFSSLALLRHHFCSCRRQPWRVR